MIFFGCFGLESPIHDLIYPSGTSGKSCHKLRDGMSHNDINLDGRPSANDSLIFLKSSPSPHLSNFELIWLHVLVNSLCTPHLYPIVTIYIPGWMVESEIFPLTDVWSLSWQSDSFSLTFLDLPKAHNLVPIPGAESSPLFITNESSLPSFLSISRLLPNHHFSPESQSLVILPCVAML